MVLSVVIEVPPALADALACAAGGLLFLGLACAGHRLLAWLESRTIGEGAADERDD